MPHQGANNNEIPIAIQQLLDAQAKLVQLMVQNQVNNPNKESPLGMQQLLVGQSELVQMMSQNMTNNENNQPQIHHDNK